MWTNRKLRWNITATESLRLPLVLNRRCRMMIQCNLRFLLLYKNDVIRVNLLQVTIDVETAIFIVELSSRGENEQYTDCAAAEQDVYMSYSIWFVIVWTISAIGYIGYWLERILKRLDWYKKIIIIVYITCRPTYCFKQCVNSIEMLRIYSL